MRLNLLYFLLFLTIPLAAQKVENVKAEVFGEGEKVVITYDITGAAQGQKFKVTLYGSHNNYASPLSLVSGDVGRDREITGGPNKRIEWSAKSELRDYAGDVTFEVRAEPAAAAFIVQHPTTGAKAKRGKAVEITWHGGAAGESVRLDLLHGGAVISQIASTTNSHKYSWTIPKSMEKGKNYQIRLSGESGSVTSGNFAIKSKTPGIVKVLPFLVVGGAAVWYFVFYDPTPPPPTGLPEPPKYNGE